MQDEPKRNEGEPSMAYRGRLMYWHHDPDAPPYETLDISERSRWTMLASGMDDIMLKAPRDPDDPRVRGGFTPHTDGPGVIGTATFVD